MTYAEQKAAEARISKILHREYSRKSANVCNSELQRIYWNLAHACEIDDAATSAAREAVHELKRLVWNGYPSTYHQVFSLRKKLQDFLNKRLSLSEQFGVNAPLGM